MVGGSRDRGSALDYRSTSRVIDPAPADGAWFIPKFISLAQVVLGAVYCIIVA